MTLRQRIEAACTSIQAIGNEVGLRDDPFVDLLTDCQTTISTLVDTVERNHRWRLANDDRDEYDGSDLCKANMEARKL